MCKTPAGGSAGFSGEVLFSAPWESALSFVGVGACGVLVSWDEGDSRGVAVAVGVAVASFGILHPLGVSLYKLHVKSSVMSLIMSSRRELPKLYDENARIEAVKVRFNDDVVEVNIDVLESETEADKMQRKVEGFQKSLSKHLNRPVVVHVDLIPVPILHFSAGREVGSAKVSDIATPHDLDQRPAEKGELSATPIIMQEEGK